MLWNQVSVQQKRLTTSCAKVMSRSLRDGTVFGLSLPASDLCERQNTINGKCRRGVSRANDVTPMTYCTVLTLSGMTLLNWTDMHRISLRPLMLVISHVWCRCGWQYRMRGTASVMGH
jgi:hypothetical protein